MHRFLWGRAEESRTNGVSLKSEKRGVLTHHGNMLPENSFPQICVVSINKIVEKPGFAQEYFGAVA
jgi:hypothetical protein